jgi:hypothetical protein
LEDPFPSAGPEDEAAASEDAVPPPEHSEPPTTGEDAFESNTLFEPLTEKPAQAVTDHEAGADVAASDRDAPASRISEFENDREEFAPERPGGPPPAYEIPAEEPTAWETAADLPPGVDDPVVEVDSQHPQTVVPTAPAEKGEPAAFDDSGEAAANLDMETPFEAAPPPQSDASDETHASPPHQLSEKEVWIPEEELPEELRDDDGGRGAVVQVEDIVGQFSAEVKADIDAEDFRSHYDLGMAYLEMDLLPEAIREFQFAANADAYQVRCLEMIGVCFLKQKQPRLAIRQLQKGVKLVGGVDKESLGLQYNLGLAYEMTGDTENAKMCFEDVYVIDVTFRDISDRMKKYAP